MGSIPVNPLVTPASDSRPRARAAAMMFRSTKHLTGMRRERRAYETSGPAGHNDHAHDEPARAAPSPCPPAEPRERLLGAAAEIFAERGYDGTRVADIAAAAGVSNGALYSHFASKAELLIQALRAHGRQMLADLFAADPDRSITDMLLVIGRWLPRRRDPQSYL